MSIWVMDGRKHGTSSGFSSASSNSRFVRAPCHFVESTSFCRCQLGTIFFEKMVNIGFTSCLTCFILEPMETKVFFNIFSSVVSCSKWPESLVPYALPSDCYMWLWKWTQWVRWFAYFAWCFQDMIGNQTLQWKNIENPLSEGISVSEIITMMITLK